MIDSFRYQGLAYRRTSSGTVGVRFDRNFRNPGEEISIPSVALSYSGKEYHVTSVDDRGFYMATTLVGLTIPGSVVEVGEEAFASCVNLKYVKIKEGVQILHTEAFCRCKSLTEIFIPASITTIDEEVFRECFSLKKIIVSDDSAYFSSYNGSLYNKDKTELVLHAPANGGTFRLPSTVRTIRQSAFRWSLHLEAIEVGEDSKSFRTIDGLLYDKSLTRLMHCPPNRRGDVVVTNGVTIIGQDAFLYCEHIRSITLPDSLNEIEQGGFISCGMLHSIVLPEKLKIIGSDAFRHCYAISSVTVHAKNPPDCDHYCTFSSSTHSNATLYVPLGSKLAYSSAPEWKDFKDIVEKDFSKEELRIEEGSVTVNMHNGKVLIKGLTCEVIVSSYSGKEVYTLNTEIELSKISVPEDHICEIKVGNKSLKFQNGDSSVIPSSDCTD